MKISLLSLLTILVNFSASAALTINKISKDSDFNNTYINPLAYNSPAIVNGNIVYFNNKGKLQISSGTLNGAREITLNGKPLNASYGGSDTGIISVDNQILFINGDDDYTLWKTDGDTFSKLSDIRMTYLTKDLGNVIHAKTLDNNAALVTIDGDNILTYNLGEQASFAHDLPVCKMDDNNIIIPAYNTNSEIGLYHYNDGNVTEIAADIINQNSFPAIPEFELMFQGDCFYRYTSEAKSYILKISMDGSVATILEDGAGKNWVNIFELGGELYLNAALEFGNGQIPTDTYFGSIYHLPQGSLTPEFKFGGYGGSIVSQTVSKDYLYLQWTYVGCSGCPIPSPPPPPNFRVYDANLNLLRDEIRNPQDAMEAFTINNKDLLLYRSEVNKIVKTNQGADEFELKTPLTTINTILGDDLAIYATGFDRNSESYSIYRISDNAIVSRQLSGLWVSDGLQSQGLSIHTGVRPNSSVYMFVSFYIYKDGLPFWVAGNADINLGDTTIDIDLYEFKGSSFLSNNVNQTDETISFGSIKITPQSCNGIDVVLDIINNDNVNLEMQRIVDTSYNNLCNE